MKKVIAIAVAVAGLMAYQANAQTLTGEIITAGDLALSNGTLGPNNMLGIVVADTSGLGLGGGVTNLAANSSLVAGNSLTVVGGGTGDYILGAFNTSADSGQQGLLSENVTQTLNTHGITAGENVYVLWFPTLTLSATTIGAGVSYGGYGGAAATAIADGGAPWTVPVSGTVSMNALTSDNGGATSQTSLDASFVTPVPEPSSIALVLIGLFGAVGLVRRRS